MSEKQSSVSILTEGLWRSNPVLVLILGTCPTLAVTSSALNGLGMGLATTFVLFMSNVAISLLRNIVPKKMRIPCFIVIIASFVTIVEMLMQAYAPALSKALGVFIPLIVVNCIVLGRAEAFVQKTASFTVFSMVSAWESGFHSCCLLWEASEKYWETAHFWATVFLEKTSVLC